MKVGHLVRAVFPQHGFGGLERAGTSLTQHLLARGVDVGLFTRPLPPGEPFETEPEWPGKLTVHTAAYNRLPLKPNGIPARLTNYKMFVDSLGKKAEGMSRSGLIQGVYAQGLCSWGVRRASEWGVPNVANPQGMEDFKVRDPLKRLAYTPFRRWVVAGCRAADRVIATDNALLAEVPALLGVDPAKVVVIPNGIDIAAIEKLIDPDVQSYLRIKWGPLTKSRFTGISVARLEENKGLKHLLQALKDASARLPEDWAWIIVGEGSQRRALEQLASELGIRPHVVFTGLVGDTELYNLYRIATVFAHPTLYEGSSLVTLEAMANGLPVVGTAVGGIPDKVKVGETGFVVPPAEPGAMAERILWLEQHRDEASRMGAEGARFAAESFGWDRIAAQTEALFRLLVEEKAACR